MVWCIPAHRRKPWVQRISINCTLKECRIRRGVSMPQSLSCVNLHIIFSTKNRLKLIPDHRKEDVFAYISTIIRDKQSQCYRIGGTDNHIHIACRQARTVAQSDLLRIIKAESSRWIRKAINPEFGWQTGYGCFSVSKSQLPKLITYIENQERHHIRLPFQDEYRDFLRRYDIAYDEKYVWD